MMATHLPPQIRERTVAKARTLLEALPFMQEHAGRVLVMKYGGAAIDSAGLAATFAEDVMLLRSVGIKPVIVHGGGPAVTQMSARLGIETTFVDGFRVTDAETLDVATMVLAGKLNTDVVAALVAGGVAGRGPVRRRRRAAARPQAGRPGPRVRGRGRPREGGRPGHPAGARLRARRGVDRDRRHRTGVQRERRRRRRRAGGRAGRREAGLSQRRPRADRADGATC